MDDGIVPFIPVAVALVVHYIVNHHEPESLLTILSCTILPPITLIFFGNSFWYSLSVYWLSLSTSILIYRLSPFHPLAKYPGPILARVSRFWWVYHAASGKHHQYAQRLHQSYGDVVRTGPNNLSIREAAAIPVILGSRDQWHKHPRYNTLAKYDAGYSLITTPSLSDHAHRRKAWDRAFTPAALTSYTPMLHNRLRGLLKVLGAQRTDPSAKTCTADLAKWVGYFAKDFMGSFAFGGLFELMEQGDTMRIEEILLNGMVLGEVLAAIPWVRGIFAALPIPPPEFMRAATRVGGNRKARGSVVKDLFYYVLDEGKEDQSSASDGYLGPGREMDDGTLGMEALLAIIAGSDTTVSAITCTIAYVVSNPGVIDRLRQEVDATASIVEHDDFMDAETLAKMPFLQAVLNETLRLQPVVPSGLQRIPPPGCKVCDVAGTIVPEGTSVHVPTYALQREPRYFSPYPEQFWPERWIPEEGRALAAAMDEEYVHDTSAFTPFAYGPGVCAGRPLAQLEMRLLVAEFVRRFDMRFAPGMTMEKWEAGLVDRVALTRGPLWLELRDRMSGPQKK